MDALLFALFIGLMVAGVPIAVAMGLAGATAVMVGGLGRCRSPPASIRAWRSTR